MIEAVIFDMDGVLVDNRDIHIDAFVRFCKRHGIDFRGDDLLAHFGKGNDEIIPEILPADIVNKYGLDALADEKEQIYREIFEESIEPTRGLVAFLKDLEACGIKCAVGSSGQKNNVDFVLDKCGIAPYFTAIVNGDMVTRCKPDPEIFLTAAKLMGVNPENCLVIEDAFAGIEAAHAAGMKVIALSTTYSVEQLEKDAEFDLLLPDFTSLTADKILSL